MVSTIIKLSYNVIIEMDPNDNTRATFEALFPRIDRTRRKFNMSRLTVWPDRMEVMNYLLRLWMLGVITNSESDSALQAYDRSANR